MVSAELIEYLRAHVRYEGMPATARAAMEQAANALASKDEENAALRLFVEQCDALFEAMQADTAFIFPSKFGSLATYRAVARSLQGDADVSRGGGDG